MSNPYTGEIRLFAGNFAPSNWAFCDGATLNISDNPTLFSLIGTTYGGDGQSTYRLPDLRGRVPLHAGQGHGLSPYVIGANGGVESVTLTTGQIPLHNHVVPAIVAPGDQASPSGSVLAGSGAVSRYVTDPPATAMSGQMLSSIGGSQPHSNQQPYQCVSFIIALYGVYPSRA